jgi:hypothetical protein
MAKIATSEQARAMAETRWRRYRGECDAGADPGAVIRQVLWCALSEVPPAVVLACAEEGFDRAKAERLANLALVILAEALRLGEDALLPHPDAWSATVAWDALFGPDGASRVAGAMVAETAREAAAGAS